MTPPHLRPATASPQDLRFLREMLYEAATWRQNRPREPIDLVLADPQLAVYFEGWPRESDTAIVAEDAETRPVGAAWYRVFDEAAHGYGYVAPSIPELGIAVRPEARRAGVGTALLAALLEQARADGFRALSLSVAEHNPALRLYRRAGFLEVGRSGGSLTMQVELA